MQIIAEKDHHHALGCRHTAQIYPDIEMRVIPGAYHAFDSREADGKRGFIGERMEYSWEATKQAREYVRAFLAKHLSGRPTS